MKRSILLITIALFTTFNTHAQGYYFRHYQVEDGLSHNTIYCTLQDSKGFMWFGTRDGLNRFDGVTFKIFRSDPADSNSIGNNFVHALFEDSKKQLWVGTNRGLYLYLSETEKFQKILTGTSASISQIQQDKTGTLWILMDGKLYGYHEKDKALRSIAHLAENRITSLCLDNNGTIWLGRHSVLQQYNVHHNTLISYNVFSPRSSALLKYITVIHDCRNGKLLVGTSNHGLKLFDKVTGTHKDILTQNTDKTAVFVRSILHTGGSEYWIGTESGLFICDIQKGTSIQLKKSYDTPYSLSDNAIYSFFKDREGNIWIGTFFGGINQFTKQYAPFQKYFPGSTPERISGNAVREICGDQYGNIWIGTEDNGLNKLDGKTNKITHYSIQGKPGDISHSNIHGIMASGNELWVSTFEHGMDRMDIRTGKVIRHYDVGHSGSKSNFFICIYRTQSGEILAGTSEELLIFDPVSHRFNRVEEVPFNSFIHHIMEDQKGTVWLSTNTGLYYYNKNLGTKGNFRYEDENPNNTINYNAVNSSFEDADGNIWAATESMGLCKVDKEKNTFSRANSEKNWQSDCVFMILQDSSKNLWMSTTKGLICFNPYNQVTRLFTHANGLLNNQFNFNSAYKDKTGRMYFGSVKGMISFNPGEFIKNTFIPPVYITSFQLNNTEQKVNTKNFILQRSAIVSSEINLKYNQSSFSIDFAALSYASPETTEYAYLLKGLDEDWTHIKTNRRVYFTNLSPGKYTFQVKASCSSGLWSQPAQIIIKITPPFWANTWAYLFYAITATLIIYSTIRFFHNRTLEKNRLRSVQMQYQKEKDFYQSKIDFFTHVAHEIKTPLTLIRGPLEKIIKKAASFPEIQKNLATMEKNTNRLIQLANQLLDFRQTETKGFSLDFSKINISKMLNELFINFKSLAEQKDISFSLTSPPDIYANADEDALNKIFGNLFSNAIKYADHEVHIKLSQESSEHITIEFTNDGYVIPETEKERIFEPFYRLKGSRKQEGSGIGLALSLSLTELHGGKLYLDSGIPDKNTFILIIPTGNVENQLTNLPLLTENDAT